MNDLISVIIPVYKVEEYLDECVSSVVSQTHKNLEIILVDDGSPDSCPRMCDTWAEKDSRIHVIHKANGGVSSARNAGLEIASGDYIAFVDSDDRIAPTMYSELIDVLKTETADIVSCGITEISIDRQHILAIPELRGSPEEILSAILTNTSFPVSVWNKICSRKLWTDLSFFPLSVGEDAIITCQLVGKSQKIVQISTPLYYYRIHDNSAMTASFSPSKMDEEEAWRIIYKYIGVNFPKFRKQAYEFYLLKVNNLMHAIPENMRKKYAEQYCYLRKIITRNLPYILFASGIQPKQRIKLFLEYFK